MSVCKMGLRRLLLQFIIVLHHPHASGRGVYSVCLNRIVVSDKTGQQLLLLEKMHTVCNEGRRRRKPTVTRPTEPLADDDHMRSYVGDIILSHGATLLTCQSLSSLIQSPTHRLAHHGPSVRTVRPHQESSCFDDPG